MGIAVNGLRLDHSICHIIVRYGTTCHSLNKLCFVSHLLSALWWLHWGWVGSAPGTDESVSVHMNKHFSECHKMDISWAYISWAYSLLQTSLRYQPLILSKLNINILLAHKCWFLLSFCFVFNSKDLNRHKHNAALGVGRHPVQPKASKIPQNNMVPTGFSTFWSGCSLEVSLSLLCEEWKEFITLAYNFSLCW